MGKLGAEELKIIESKIIRLLKGEIHEIVKNTRENMIVVEEKLDGDSATIADIQIGKLFEEELTKLLSNSIVIQEESFDENVFLNLKSFEYIWVIDPIDGTRAFRDVNNFEWCVGCCLLENLRPVFAAVYLPEPWLHGEPLLLSAIDSRQEVLNFGNQFQINMAENAEKYISHIHTDTCRNFLENAVAQLFPQNEIYRAYVGHSTLAQCLSIAFNDNKVFSRRNANIWDIVQSAYIIEKLGFEVFYENGYNIFPLDLSKLALNGKHLILPQIIASSRQNKEKIMKQINSKSDN